MPWMAFGDAHPDLFFIIVIFVVLPLVAGVLTAIVERVK